MIYLDNGATSLRKPREVGTRMAQALRTCANPGRGGHSAAELAARVVYGCREQASALFSCMSEQVVLTPGCTYGLNVALRTLFTPGKRVAVTGFEHNAVMRTLHGIGAEAVVCGRKLFDWEDSLSRFEDALRRGVSGAVFTHVSNVFGYVLPVEEMAALCRAYRVPFAVDAAQSAGSIPISFQALGADFVAMPGHKGLLGPQGTGILLCADVPKPLVFGGTGTDSGSMQMPGFLPEAAEAGTMNVPGIAGLSAALEYLRRVGVETIGEREHAQVKRCVKGLKALGLCVFSGAHQAGTVSFVPEEDCEEVAMKLSRRGAAVRAGLHCAPLAHESAGTLNSGTVRISFGTDACDTQTDRFLSILRACR